MELILYAQGRSHREPSKLLKHRAGPVDGGSVIELGDVGRGVLIRQFGDLHVHETVGYGQVLELLEHVLILLETLVHFLDLLLRQGLQDLNLDLRQLFEGDDLPFHHAVEFDDELVDLGVHVDLVFHVFEQLEVLAIVLIDVDLVLVRVVQLGHLLAALRQLLQTLHDFHLLLDSALNFILQFSFLVLLGGVEC